MPEIYRASDPPTAHLIAGMLQSHGIQAAVTGELLFGTRGEAPLDLSTLPAIVVPEGTDLQQALRLIRDYLAQEPARVPLEPWMCPACGEEIEAQFSSCWSCLQPRPDPD
jgi:hypothetical protein